MLPLVLLPSAAMSGTGCLIIAAFLVRLAWATTLRRDGSVLGSFRNRKPVAAGDEGEDGSDDNDNDEEGGRLEVLEGAAAAVEDGEGVVDGLGEGGWLALRRRFVEALGSRGRPVGILARARSGDELTLDEPQELGVLGTACA